MSEDRPTNDPAVELGQLRRDYEDLKSTLLAQVHRRPVGDIEETLRDTPKANTVFAHGQTVSRTTYAVLWQWVVDNNLSPSVFGAGDGATTFVLPDYRGRGLVGATAARPVGTLFGSATKGLTVGNLPPHSHGGSTGVDSPSHQHYSGGNHGNHRPTTQVGPGGTGAAWTTTDSSFSGDVGWSGNASAGHTHGFTTGNTGSGDPVNVEAPSVSVNVLIWT